VFPARWLARHSRIEQYMKDGRALRIETVVNDAYDLGCGRLLDTSAPSRPGRHRPKGSLGLEVVGDGAQDGGDLLRVPGIRVLAAAVGV
jgi:hypothetical protein